MPRPDTLDLSREMLRRHAAHEDGWVDACYHPDCEWVEVTGNQDVPGRSGGIDALKQASDVAERVFPDMTIDVTNILGDGERVALELDFTGARPARAGTDGLPKVSKYKMTIFLTFKDDLIIRQVDYLIPVL